MKRFFTSIAAGTLLAAFAMAQPLTYRIVDLGGRVGGSYNSGNAISNNGLAGGVESFPDGTQRAVLWYTALGLTVDIANGRQGGPNAGVFGVNERGEALVSAEISAQDPSHENFCGLGTGRKCLGFSWQGGRLTQLPTLGGNNATVGDNVNNRGEMPGVAETATRDPHCPAGVASNGTGPQLFDYEAVIWGPGLSDIRKLNPLTGDTVGMAFWVNDNGQAAGATGTCANTVLPPFAFGAHAVLWEKDGSATDLGNLGGTVNPLGLGVGNVAFVVNNSGQVTGASPIPSADGGPSTAVHAFLWTRGVGMRDLGALSGDVMSAGLGMNDGGDVVGASVDGEGNARAFVWRNGAMSDLNAVSHGAPLFLATAFAINAGGTIVGFGATDKGDLHAFLAIPEISANARVGTPVVLSKEVRAMLRRPGLIPSKRGPAGN